MTSRECRWFLAMLAAVLVVVMLHSRRARADDAMPGGITCSQVVEYARVLAIPNTWRGRAQARVIALTFGIAITDSQLETAAKCLRQYSEDQKYGCSVRDQTPSGECR